ncbi:hypothetical protein HY625_00245 [Candidatus Uhrbacteria bacterium]|nr:hypothetical protein [Candidatus Uhrbacteria bacterium]
MRQDTVTITADQEGRLHRWIFKLVTLVVIGRIPLQAVLDAIRALFEQFAPDELPEEDGQKHDESEKRRAAMEQFYRSIGIFLTVPKPEISNREFDRRRKAGQELFWRFATTLVSYEAFMAACGQAGHWTVTDEAKRAMIVWETAAEGYWYWADVAPSCPRPSTSWNDLTAAICLLFIEEYVITWHVSKEVDGVVLDVPSYCWLRTLYNKTGALGASGYDGRVVVCDHYAENLATSWGYFGGRAAEMVKRSAA